MTIIKLKNTKQSNEIPIFYTQIPTIPYINNYYIKIVICNLRFVILTLLIQK